MTRPLLTEMQLKVLRAIAAGISQNGWAPSVREICEAIKVASASGVIKTLKRLANHGYIRREIATSRGMSLTAAGMEVVYPQQQRARQ